MNGEPPRRDDPPIDAAALAIDPALVRYRQAAEIATGFAQVRALAVGADDRIWVGGDRAVRCFAPDGARHAEIILGGEPNCLATVGGRLYVGLEEHLEVFDLRGTRLAAWKTLGEQAILTAVATAEHDVLAADAGNRIVWRYDDGGRIQGRIGAASQARRIPGFLITSRDFDLALGADGLVYVVNPRALRVEGYTLAGDLERHWGQGSPALADFFGCCNPAHLAVLPDGRFVTAEKGIPRIKVYTAEGRFECVVAGPRQMAATAAAVATDRRGRIYALDPVARSVRIFERTNEINHKGTKVLRPSAAGVCASFRIETGDHHGQ